MEIGKIGHAQTSFYAKETKRKSPENLPDMESVMNERIKKNPSSIPGKEGEMWAPYCQLKNENGVVEYNGVVFTLDYQRKWLCLGDVTNLEDVIRVPLSEGGCLMVNRDSVDELGRAIGMFSPEDINRILRALKMDAKIQQMKREVEEMEDGIGKTSEEQNADSDKEAREAAEEKGNAGGFNGYTGDAKEGIAKLEDWQLEALTKDFSEQYLFLNSAGEESEGESV